MNLDTAFDTLWILAPSHTTMMGPATPIEHVRQKLRDLRLAHAARVRAREELPGAGHRAHDMETVASQRAPERGRLAAPRPRVLDRRRQLPAGLIDEHERRPVRRCFFFRPRAMSA